MGLENGSAPDQQYPISELLLIEVEDKSSEDDEDNDNDETDCDIDIDTRKRFYVDKPEGSYFNAQPRRLQAAANVAIIDCFTVGFSDTIGADGGSKTTETMSLWNCEMANEYGDQSVLVSTDTSDIAPQTYRELSIVGTSKYITILSPEVDFSVGVAPKNISIKQIRKLVLRGYQNLIFPQPIKQLAHYHFSIY